MAYPYSAAEARSLREQATDLTDRLRRGAGEDGARQELARRAAEKLRLEETQQMLARIPVEELNRRREGFRIALLRSAGLETLADLWQASPGELAALHGVGEESAMRIKLRAEELSRSVRDSLRLRLDPEQPGEADTALVKALCVCLRSEEPAARCRTLAEEPGAALSRAAAEAELAARPLRRLLASRERKERAQAACAQLEALLHGGAAADAEAALRALEQAGSVGDGEAWSDFSARSAAYYSLLDALCPGLIAGGDEYYGLPEELALAVSAQEYSAEGLRCRLRRYQDWGVRYILHQKRVLLGDEMGLGKTVQAIAAMVALRNAGESHFLVICPASVLANWCKEIPRHSDLPVTMIYGAARASALQSWIASGGAAVTTYETAAFVRLPEQLRLGLLTVDEAHYVKNPAAQRTLHAARLSRQAERVLFMTGTALENRVDEMIALIRLLRPELAGQLEGIAFLSAAPEFRQRVAPVYYRRRREDVLTELPELVESREYCDLTLKERIAYETAVLIRDYAGARRVSWNVDDPRESSKGRRLLELVEEAADEGRKVLVFTFFLDTAQKVCRLLGTRAMEPINGSVPPKRRQEIVERFDAAPAGSVLVAQIQSGGTGLNIQSASVVILCEPQFKPSTENQAISRAYRMGQVRSVLVYRLLCENTVDERILELLEDKQAAFDAFADRSEAAEAQETLALDEQSFGRIMDREAERIRARRESEEHTPGPEGG